MDGEHIHRYHSTARLNKEQKTFLVRGVKERIPPGDARQIAINWILYRANYAAGLGMAKRWGVELPGVNNLDDPKAES